MILVIDKSKKEGRSFAEAFKYMGIVARAESPSSASGEISTFYRLIIIVDPHTLPDEREYVRNLRSYLGGVPIMALTDSAIADPAIYELSAGKSLSAAEIYGVIRKYFKSSRLYPPGEYLLFGLDASAEARFVTNYSTVLSLTKTESMILRTLIRAHPIPLSPKDLLKYAFNQSKLPDPRSIRTYVCSINKKFQHHFKRKLIVSIEGGYTVLTPDLAEKENIEFDFHNELRWII